MKKCKITVLKTTLDKELAEEYGAEGLTACPMMKEGQCFITETGSGNLAWLSAAVTTDCAR